ncbi:MAG: FHA domain-containing protein [Candidatus Chaera renei]|uniref:FHA domain-containing protein n=1 Tax=Candidatus Chaera renei TaxID=2506947 RepID=A0A4Q0AJB9_9BACT|nr:MAG: FHA domain-containing protein [Candidatus Chaera renei]
MKETASGKAAGHSVPEAFKKDASAEIARLPRQRDSFEEVGLLGKTLVLPVERYLYDRDLAVDRFGVNGDILAVLKLPTYRQDHLTTLDIGVVDFGAKASGCMFMRYDTPLPTLGQLPQGDRYALVGLNYTCGEHLSLWVPLTEAGVVLGRNDEYANYRLGIVNGRLESPHSMISRRHVTVRPSKDGFITVKDHSTNGTIVARATSTRNQI